MHRAAAASSVTSEKRPGRVGRDVAVGRRIRLGGGGPRRGGARSLLSPLHGLASLIIESSLGVRQRQVLFIGVLVSGALFQEQLLVEIARDQQRRRQGKAVRLLEARGMRSTELLLVKEWKREVVGRRGGENRSDGLLDDGRRRLADGAQRRNVKGGHGEQAGRRPGRADGHIELLGGQSHLHGKGVAVTSSVHGVALPLVVTVGLGFVLIAVVDVVLPALLDDAKVESMLVRCRLYDDLLLLHRRRVEATKSLRGIARRTMELAQHRGGLAVSDGAPRRGAVLLLLRYVSKRGLVRGQRRAGKRPGGLRGRRLDRRELRVVDVEVLPARRDGHGRERLGWVIRAVGLRVAEASAGLGAFNLNDGLLLLVIFKLLLEAGSPRGRDGGARLRCGGMDGGSWWSGRW